jgi:glycine/serine hydroxymethyltransferase
LIPLHFTVGQIFEEMKRIASLSVKVLNNIDDPGIQKQVREKVSQICRRFPVPEIDD